jgi:alkanesulfonate monooxygenase SsuD/methylene tetrahydromethanopterin reductase-like flavin-dependent oxidoreductase (luciferase family)
VGFVTRTEADRRRKAEAAHRYYGRFDNVFTGPGLVDNGMIRELPHAQTVDELAASLLIGTPQQVIDKLAPYAELGIDRVIINPNFGCDASETLDSLQCFAEEVMPHFTGRPAAAAAAE